VVRKVNKNGIISRLIGNGTFGDSGDGGPATAAELGQPDGIYADTSGNIYVSDESWNVIRKVNSNGIITTIAGKGSLNAGFSGDGAQATAAELNFPFGVCTDKTGNLYIADAGNNRIRMVNTAGIISTIAGTGTAGFNGDGIQATAAELAGPRGLCMDATGNIYIADAANFRIRKISVSGLISTVAGSGTQGFSGDGAQAIYAELNVPMGISLDSAGNIFFADAYNYRIREVSTSGIISTVAGNGTEGYIGDGGLAIYAELANPIGVCNDKHHIFYESEAASGTVRKIAPGYVNGVDDISTVKDVSLFPNPNNGIFNLQLSAVSGQSSVEMYNMLGEKVYASPFITHNSSFIIDLSGQPQGLYHYRIITKNGSFVSTGKFVIEK